MQVVIRPDGSGAARLTAAVIAHQIRTKPHCVLGLATGGTMVRVYDELVRMHDEQDLDFSLVRTFNLDEYEGLGPEHPNSYRRYMNENLFCRVNIDLRNTHLPHGDARDYEAECERYEELIRECGGIDLQLLGIGKSGHIGFNEPLSALQSRTRDKALTPTTIRQNQKYFSPPESMPRRGITMGVGTILEARRIILLATGSEKAKILAKAVEGPVTSMISATALQLHPACSIIADEDAAAKLSQQEYYHWMFQNELEWQQYKQDVGSQL